MNYNQFKTEKTNQIVKIVVTFCLGRHAQIVVHPPDTFVRNRTQLFKDTIELTFFAFADNAISSSPPQSPDCLLYSVLTAWLGQFSSVHSFRRSSDPGRALCTSLTGSSFFRSFLSRSSFHVSGWRILSEFIEAALSTNGRRDSRRGFSVP